MKFINQCDHTIPQALRYLATHPRPTGGQERFNAEHLFQLADEFEKSLEVKAGPVLKLTPEDLASIREIPSGKSTLQGRTEHDALLAHRCFEALEEIQHEPLDGRSPETLIAWIRERAARALAQE